MYNVCITNKKGFIMSPTEAKSLIQEEINKINGFNVIFDIPVYMVIGVRLYGESPKKYAEQLVNEYTSMCNELFKNQ